MPIKSRTRRPLRPAELHILVALARDDRHGYAIKQEVETRSGGAIRLGPGTLYETIGRLLDADLIRETRAPKNAREHAQRRYYALTTRGRRTLQSEVERLGDLLELARERLAET